MFNDTLRVAALPLDIAQGDKQANLDAVERAMTRLPEGTDVVVLPELFSTGYIDDAEQIAALAERNTGATVDFLRALAARHSVAIAGSFLAFTAPHYYNRGFVIEPNGDETFYDKRHLFSIGSEAARLTPGDRRMAPVRFRGWNMELIVCYDLRFPVWCRARHADYDLLLVVANWPASRGYAFTQLLIARAIENQAAVVGCNRGGADAFGSCDGLTQIFDSRGMPVGVKPDDCPFVVADLSRSRQDDYRRNFPVAADADDFELLS